MADITPLGPLLTAHLFPTLDGRLIELLRALTPGDRSRQTLAPAWTVKDVAAHLLDTQLRRLSFGRDRCTPSRAPAISSERELVAFINQLNAEGVAVYSRFSPPLLIEWSERTGREAAAYYASLDPSAPATIGVSWAGEQKSANWFDLARELTERWHHQQQIRLAIAGPAGASAAGNPARDVRAIMTRELYHPVLDCFMRALPFHYRNVGAAPGSAVRIHVAGDCGGDWYLYRDDNWLLTGDPAGRLVASISVPQDIAWRIFTKGIAIDDARRQVEVTGDATLATHVLGMLAIVG